MNDEKVKFNRVIVMRGSSPSISIPSELMKFLKLEAGDKIELIGDSKRHGNFIALFKPKEKKDEIEE